MALAWLKRYRWWDQKSEPSSVSPRRAAQSPLTRLFERHFFSIAALLLVILAGTQIGSAVLESPTNDEPIHLTAGYVYLTTGKYSMDLTHPPLGRILAALPLLPLPLKHIPAERAWLEFKNLIWGNRIPADSIMIRARLVIIALTLLFGAWLAWWTRRHFGSSVALLALAFFVFDPNLIAHGHYVTTDLIVSFGIFLACTLWADFLHAPGWKKLTLAALGLGFALASKYSALFLLLALPLLYGAAWWRRRGRPFFTLRGAIETWVVMIAGASLFVALTYAPEVGTLIHLLPSGQNANQPSTQPLARATLLGTILSTVAHYTPLFSFGYFRGLHELALHNAEGHPAYLVGHVRQYGWWEYFPIAFLVKTPTGVLVACLIAALSLFRGWRRLPSFLLLACLALPPLIYFAISMRSSIDIGIRHILPIYAFLYVLLAVVLVHCGPLSLRRVWPWAITVVIALVGAESLAIYPHYLAYFNLASGGPADGPRYLLDSNIDWGQDEKNLERFVEQRDLKPLCTFLFGTAPAKYYSVDSRDLLQTGMPEGVERLPCVVAVSVNFLRGPIIPPSVFAPLRSRRPVAKVGYSIYLYDLRR